jgi:hypothetical protein
LEDFLEFAVSIFQEEPGTMPEIEATFGDEYDMGFPFT